MGHEAFERGGGREPVEQAASEAAMQGADDVLVLAYRVAVGTVAQPAAQAPIGLMVDLRCKAKRGQQVSDRPFGGAAVRDASCCPISRPVASISPKRAGVAGMLRAGQTASAP
jgi:hypothetical protein